MRSEKAMDLRITHLHTSRCKRSRFSNIMSLMAAMLLTSTSHAFQVPSCRSVCHRTILLASVDEVTVNLERAKALLEKSKEKLALKRNGAPTESTTIVDVQDKDKHADDRSLPPLPFFASREAPPTTKNKRQRVIKTFDEETGLITTDGDEMARLSEQEEWEVRSLFEVFENEIKDKDAYSVTSKQLASRDVAASIWNLRKTLQMEDYKRIFDKRNRFIGEDN